MNQDHHKRDHLHWAHPLVREWFIQKWGEPTEPQKQGWPSIAAGLSTLISAPTGSGKTFSAFLVCIDQLVRKALSGRLAHQTEVLYVSPLKALGNDIQKNLMGPLEEIAKLAKEKNINMDEITVAVRTGDTLMRERQAMLKKPPHILVTTPESFYILLTAEKSRQILKSIKTVIVDEVHAMANDKRGTHFLLSLERLEAIAHVSPVRIGLSATQKPIETVARFLAGNDRPLPEIVHIGHAKHLELTIDTPELPLGAVASHEMWDQIYDKVAKLTEEHRSTLVFVNTRKLAERVAHHLAERIGEDKVAAHHGSLSRKLRLSAETRLKSGELKVLVATASLELGIDIGSIDLVCQLGSPRSIAVMLQRIGRAGHWHGAISKGRLFATTRDELVECAALVWAIKQGDLDQLIIPEEPIDILAQQVVAACATNDWNEDELYQCIKKSFHYQHLTRERFNTVLKMLSEGIAGSRGRYSAYLLRDQVNHVVKARRGARLTAITSGGAIPENGLFTVIAEPDQVMVGTLDEDFAVESNRGDIFLLGTTSWRVLRVESAAGKVIVQDAHGAPPSVPFWRGEAPGRTDELSLQVAQLRQRVVDFQDNRESGKAWLMENAGLKLSDAEQLIEYLMQGYALLGAVPTQETIIAERFFDESGGMQLVIHAPFGARINKAWGLALRKCFCRSFNFELQASATDNGINIALAEQHSFPLADVFQFVHPNTLKKTLTQAVLQSPLFATRWRWVAGRSLVLVRFRGGKKIPPNIQRMLADDLLAAVFPDAAACQDNLGGRDIELPDHPLIDETMKDALNEAMDFEGLVAVISKIIQGEIKCIAKDTPTPSVFSHEILSANPYAFLDDAPLEERRARAVEMRRMLPEKVLEEIGRLDPEAILEVEQQAWPDIRNSDELHDVLQTFIAFPTDLKADHLMNLSVWESYFETLKLQDRAFSVSHQGKSFWVAAEKAKTFATIYPNATLPDNRIEIDEEVLSYDDALLQMLRGWMFHSGPTTAQNLAENLALPLSDVDTALLKLEASGLILRGRFREQGEVTEWCERRLLARIHRLTLNQLRRMIEPVLPSQFMQWLLKWQHRLPGTQLSGEQGLIEVIRQLQGFEIPANAWEKEILAKRLTDYDPDLLDRLCMAGIVGWCRLSPHPATLPKTESNEALPAKKARVTPSSIVPITFFIREEAFWMFESEHEQDEDLTGLSSLAQKIYQYLKQRGAAFFADIVRGIDGLKAEVEKGLWELVAAGRITADDFDNLRALIDPRRRLRKTHRHRPRYSFSRGRWSLLQSEKLKDVAAHTEAACWMLLKRYGVVFRDLLEREKNIPSWRELLWAFRRLEDRGEIRGGRFVTGFAGEQFALPYCVDSLRASRERSEKEAVTLSAVDPLNLAGIILPGARTGAISGKTVEIA